MATGKARQKAMVARAKKRSAKAESYKRREDGLPCEDSNYGKRWWARRRGEPMAAREIPPWWTRGMKFDRFGALS